MARRQYVQDAGHHEHPRVAVQEAAVGPERALDPNLREDMVQDLAGGEHGVLHSCCILRAAAKQKLVSVHLAATIDDRLPAQQHILRIHAQGPRRCADTILSIGFTRFVIRRVRVCGPPQATYLRLVRLLLPQRGHSVQDCGRRVWLSVSRLNKQDQDQTKGEERAYAKALFHQR